VKRVLVIGDAIADVYREFEYKKPCPDAPDTPAAIQSSRDVRPGGAANVAVNLAALAPDAAVDLVCVIGMEVARAVKAISSNRVDMHSSILVDDEQGLVKERILIGGMDSDRRSFVARLDNRRAVEPTDADYLADYLERYLVTRQPDLIVLSDYDGGALTERVMALLAPLRDRLIVDTKRTDLSCFSSGGRSVISGVPESRSLFVKLNRDEHRRVLLHDPIPERNFMYFVVTRGAGDVTLTVYRDASDFSPRGVSIMGSTSQTMRIHAVSGVDVVDVCGCGDTFLAGIAAGLLRYNDPYEAVAFANAAAADVVSKPRTAVASLEHTLELTGRTVSVL
jgi:D-beta-D-heptose 7-phosphate kinase/D-beta-D-heptose 1-phosphate adenosyltransferase